jgi:hypothetical protein
MIILDAMEYSSDALAKAAWVISDINQSLGATASSDYAYTGYPAANAIDGSLSTVWSCYGGSMPNWLKIDYGTPRIINKIKISPYSGAGICVKDFSFLGSNDDANWDTLLTAQVAESSDLQSFSFSNFTQYRYYKLNVTSSWGTFVAINELESYQASNILISSESTIKQQGSYSLKLVAPIATSLDVTVTHTLSPTFNLSGQTSFKFNVHSSRTGSNFKIGLHDSGGTTTEVTPNIVAADTFQEVTLDLSSVADADKDAIDSIILTVTNADAENTIYLDYLTADNVTWPDAKYVYHGVDRGDGTTGTLHASTISEAAGAGSNLSAGILKDGEVVDDVTGTYAGGGTDFPDPANVLEGDTTNGVPGTYHEAATAEVKNGITFGPSSGYTGTYSPGGTYTEGQAAQLATDQAAVNAAKASIKDDTTILTIAGTYDFTAAIAAAAAAQLVTDQVAVLAKASYIIDSQTILSQAGLYHEATPGEVAYGITFGPSSSYTGTFGQSAVGNEEDIIKNLFIALKARLTAITNDLNTDIADRLYKDVAPHGAQFPYVVASLVTDVPDKTFTEDYSDVYVQFSLFSNDAGSTTELENMYAHLKELYDECELSVTGAYWVWMKRQNATRIDDDTTTENGNSHVFGYAVDYWVRLSKH